MKFGIKRAQVLKAGKKAKMYNFQSLITNEHVEFIQQYGRKHSRTIRGDTSRREITLSKGRLESLKTEAKNTPDRDIAAHLEKIVYENPCRLLEDEKELIESLDIQMTRIFKMLILYESERVSTIWEIYTETEDDTRKWANIAPPASGPKQEKVQTWLHFQEECLSSNS